MVTARGWSALVLSLSFLLLLLCALAVYLLDPFEHYRESAILPLYDQESYNNPGIARNYDYDAVILGTSMVEMSSPRASESIRYTIETMMMLPKLPVMGMPSTNRASSSMVVRLMHERMK